MSVKNLSKKIGVFLAIGMIAFCLTAVCTGCGGKSEQKDKSVSNLDGNYSVYRVDTKWGATGDTVGHSPSEFGAEGDYVRISEGKTINLSLFGVAYNGSIEKGKEKKITYSGQNSYPATQLLLDGKDDATVGSVIIEAYEVDGAPFVVVWGKAYNAEKGKEQTQSRGCYLSKTQ